MNNQIFIVVEPKILSRSFKAFLLAQDCRTILLQHAASTTYAPSPERMVLLKKEIKEWAESNGFNVIEEPAHHVITYDFKKQKFIPQSLAEKIRRREIVSMAVRKLRMRKKLEKTTLHEQPVTGVIRDTSDTTGS